MVIRETPSDLDNFLIVESSDIGFKLQQKGISPMFMDGDAMYFKKSNKLRKIIKKLDLDIEF